MEPASARRFVVQRRDLRQTHLEAEPAGSAPLPEGAVRLRVDSFAFTSNNITYAVLGDWMKYWQFFPTGDEATGCIPVWGFATVTESRCEGVAEGERLYGFYPMATHAVLHPTRVAPDGFVDGAAHRRELMPVYNHYLRCSADPGYHPAREAEQALLRPLFTTSFLIDDFLADNGFFGAKQVLLSSASSKTAYGAAFCLSRRRGSPDSVRVIGLTSPGNLEFTRGLGCYDEVLAYDQVSSLAAREPAVYVDFAGSASVRSTVHHHFQDRLTYSCSVGGTHWGDLGGGAELPGPRPTLFFAPAQVKKRGAPPPEGWGPAGLQQRIAEAWIAFMKPLTDARSPWLTVVRGQGESAVREAYLALLEGRAHPKEGHVLAL